MNFLKKIFLIFIVLNLTSLHAKPVPGSFADLAEKLMPSVVNISTTQTVKTTTNNFPFQFPPGSPFGEMFKDFERPTERKASSLGSGFIIKDNGTVITNNHVIANAEDILVRGGDKEYEAKVVGADPYMDIAVLKMKTNEKFSTVKFASFEIILSPSSLYLTVSSCRSDRSKKTIISSKLKPLSNRCFILE